MARKKKGLPFVVQPRLAPIKEVIGTEESGQIEIERKGYLTVAEKAISQNAVSGDESVKAVYAMAGTIARDTGKQVSEVMSDMMQEVRPEYMQPWDEDILALIMDMMVYQERVNLINATALIICRVDPEWTVKQSMELHPDLVTGLALLFRDEDNRSTEALQAAVDNTEGRAEGKQ